MANKPASKTNKRGPTKASALKALDLTEEDLELLQLIKNLPEDLVEEGDVQASDPLHRDHGVVQADHHQGPSASRHPESEEEQVFFARNLRNVDLGFRLTRQDGKKKRTNLKARGRRGDLVKLTPEDLTDQAMLDQVNAGLIEVITKNEAQNIVSKQSTNHKEAVHPAMEMLRNELGQEYAPGAFRVEAEYNNQGETVATVEGVNEGASRQQINSGGIQRSTGNVGGNPNIVSDGFAEAPSGQEADYHRDQIARQNNTEGPAAGLGDITVTVDPVQKT
jgi:hypothetical protein